MADIPSFVNRDPAEIMAETRVQMEALLGRQIMPAQFEQLVLQIICYRETLLLERFNAGMAQMLYQYSVAPLLDYIASLVAVERLPAARAGATVRFNLVPGHLTVTLPEGTRVATKDNLHIFETQEDVIIPSSQNSVELLVTAQDPGAGANGYAIGDVNVILDPKAWISSVENITVTGGGSDTETDEALRERIRLAPSQYSTAGSRSSYIFHAKSANASIIDVGVDSPVPGTVMVVPLLPKGSDYTQVITDVYNTCSAETVRPLTDTVIVTSPTEIHYDIGVNLILYNGTDSETTKTSVYNALQAYADGQALRLGRDIVRSRILEICRLNGVYDVFVVNPPRPDPLVLPPPGTDANGNLIVEFDEVAICDSITVTVIGFNNG